MSGKEASNTIVSEHHVIKRAKRRGIPGYSRRHFAMVSPPNEGTLCGAKRTLEDIDHRTIEEFQAKGMVICAPCLIIAAKNREDHLRYLKWKRERKAAQKK